MIKAGQFGLGTIWGIIKSPFEWVGNMFGGVFTGGIWGGVSGAVLAVVGPALIPFAQGLFPGLESVGWLNNLGNYMATHSFTERLAFLGLGGAGVGAAGGAALGTVKTFSDTWGQEAEYETNARGEQERVVGHGDGQKLGMTVGTTALAVGTGIFVTGLLKETDIIGGEEADKAEGHIVATAKTNEKETNVTRK